MSPSTHWDRSLNYDPRPRAPRQGARDFIPDPLVEAERRQVLARREAAERDRQERKAKGLDVRHLDPATTAVKVVEKDPLERTIINHNFKRRRRA